MGLRAIPPPQSNFLPAQGMSTKGPTVHLCSAHLIGFTPQRAPLTGPIKAPPGRGGEGIRKWSSVSLAEAQTLCIDQLPYPCSVL